MKNQLTIVKTTLNVVYGISNVKNCKSKSLENMFVNAKIFI